MTMKNHIIITFLLLIISNIYAVAQTVDAGADQTVCDSEATLNGSSTIGEWSIISGYGVFENATLFNTRVTQLNSGENIFRWTVKINNSDVSDDVTIINQKPSSASVMTDKTICENEIELIANNPFIGNGKWSVIKGNGQLDDANTYNTMVRQLSQGENIFRWSITNGECTSYAEVKITNNAIIANAGVDAEVCGDTYTMRANPPGENATGMWTLQIGNGIIENPTLFNTVVNKLLTGANTFRWKINNGNCSDYHEIVIRNNKFIPEAGEDQVLCEDYTDLQANLAIIGKGKWTIEEGSGIIEYPTKNITPVKKLGLGSNIFRWTVTEKGCASFDEVFIANYSVKANAGNDEIVCSGATTQFIGNDPGQGTGTWTVKSGQANIIEPNNPQTMITNIGQGANTLTWSISKTTGTLTCIDWDDVVVSNYEFEVYMKTEDIVCGDTYELHTNDPGTGAIGLWTVEGGGNQTIENPTYFRTMATNLSLGNNLFRWTVQKNGCSASKTISVRNDLYEANAGTDIATCANEVQLSAFISNNTIIDGVKTRWSVVSGSGYFTYPIGYNGDDDPQELTNAVFEDMKPGINILRWAVTKENSIGDCVDYDDVIINNKAVVLSAGKDFIVCGTNAYLKADVIPESATGYWSSPVNESIIFESTSANETLVSNLQRGNNTLKWTVEYNGCIGEDYIVISNNEFDVYAGDEQTIYEASAAVQLNADDIPNGADWGHWTVTAGSGSFSCGDPYIPNSDVCSLGLGKNVFRWTVKMGGCTAYSDAVVNFAGNDMRPIVCCLDINTCSSSTAISARPPLTGEAKWVAISNGLSFEDAESANTNVYGLNKGKNLIEWAVTQNNYTWRDTLIVYNNSFDLAPIPDIITCEPNITIEAEPANDNSSVYYSAYWTGDLAMNSSTDNTLNMELQQAGVYDFVWNVKRKKNYSADVCTSQTSAHVIFSPVATPQINFSETISCINTIELAASIQEGSTGNWEIVEGDATIISHENSSDLQVGDLSVGENIFKWTVSNDHCESSATTTVIYNPITAQVDVTQMDCQLNPAGKINISATGGNGTLSYSLDNGFTFADNNGEFTDLSFGGYRIKIKDSEDCEIDLGEFRIDELIMPQIDNVDFLGFENDDISNGKIEIQVSGGASPFVYWVGDVQQSSGLFENLSPGNYQIRIEDHKGCEAMYTFNLTNTSTSISTSTSTSIINLFPNPATATVTLVFDAPNFDIANIEIIDILGRVYLSKEVENNQTTIDIRSLKAGVYLVKVSSGNSVEHKMLVVE